jgi:ribosomal protein L7/L12
MSTLLLLKERKERREPAPAESRHHAPSEGTSILVCGWRKGFNKVEATKLLRNYCGYGLKDAKCIVDQILSGELTDVFVPKMTSMEVVAERLQLIGAAVVPKSKQRIYHIVPKDGAWSVKADRAQRATRVFTRQKEAIEFARGRIEGLYAGVLLVHGRDGRICRKIPYSVPCRGP